MRKLRLQEKFQDTNNNTAKWPMNKSPSPIKEETKKFLLNGALVRCLKKLKCEGAQKWNECKWT